MELKRSSWDSIKHEPAKRTDVINPIRFTLEHELQIPQNPHKPLINLGLGMFSLFLNDKFR